MQLTGREERFVDRIDDVTDDRTVLHVIAGVDDINVIMKMCRQKPRKILVLG
jgi:hypothetical protein